MKNAHVECVTNKESKEECFRRRSRTHLVEGKGTPQRRFRKESRNIENDWRPESQRESHFSSRYLRCSEAMPNSFITGPIIHGVRPIPGFDRSGQGSSRTFVSPGWGISNQRRKSTAVTSDQFGVTQLENKDR